MNIIKKYRSLSYEQKVILYTVIGLCFSAVLSAGKLVIGLFTDYNLCIVALYAFCFLLAKLQCVLGAKSKKISPQKRNFIIFLLLLLSSAMYIIYNVLWYIFGRNAGEYGLGYVCIIALISFVELGVSIYGLYKTKNRGHFYRNIKIINFGTALIAILSTQITILDFMASRAELFNALSGIAVGCFIALCSVYILVAPKVSVTGREHNAFALEVSGKNEVINLNEKQIEILLCKSIIYGSYVYRATLSNSETYGYVADGYIVREPSLWKRMPIYVKVICCILSEILIFVWLFGRVIFFFRSLNLPKKLNKKMTIYGFKNITETYL